VEESREHQIKIKDSKKVKKRLLEVSQKTEVEVRNTQEIP